MTTEKKRLVAIKMTKAQFDLSFYSTFVLKKPPTSFENGITGETVGGLPVYIDDDIDDDIEYVYEYQ